jgi:aerobic carbon-monoxide dehydrogenase medium subunit
MPKDRFTVTVLYGLEAPMFPAQFDYRPASSVDEALEALVRYGDDARVLAGGQSLIPAMRFRLARPAMLVDINPIAELDYLRESGGQLQIGATTRDYLLETSTMLGDRYRLIADTAAVVADPVVRQMGTVVGSLCHNDPAGDWPVTALASRAQVVVRGKDGARTISIDDFIVDSYTTAVGTGEMAVEVRFPTPVARTSGSYQKIERKVGDFATAAAGVQITLAPDGTIADAGIAIGALGPKALRVSAAEKLLKGAKPSKALIEQAMREAQTVADPNPDNRGSVEYKRAMAGVLVGRALRQTLERLGVGGLA